MKTLKYTILLSLAILLGVQAVSLIDSLAESIGSIQIIEMDSSSQNYDDRPNLNSSTDKIQTP